MRSHCFTCHPTLVNTPLLNPGHTGWYSIYLTQRDRRLSCPRWLVTCFVIFCDRRWPNILLTLDMSDKSDAKQILTVFPLENWRRQPGCPRSTWMKTTQQTLESLNLSLNEAIDVAQNRSLWRMMSTFGAIRTHSGACSEWVSEWMNEWMEG